MTGSLMEISQAMRDKGTRLHLQEHLIILPASCQAMKLGSHLFQCGIGCVVCCWALSEKPYEVTVVAVAFEQ